MGLSIYYNGQFKKNSSLEEMIDELEDISKIYGWEYHIFERKFPAKPDKTKHDGKLYGICFTPPGSETVTISFLSNGKMSGPIQLQLYGNSKNKLEQEYLYMLFVKTQFAGSEIHMLLIHLLKYLEGKYFTGFKLEDDGQYWETGDKELLRATFKKYTEMIDNFSSALQNIPKSSGETVESYLERLARLLKNGD
jgi:hypothetical protein